MSFTPTLNLPSLKRKGVMAHFGGIREPFWSPTEVFLEGQPLKRDTTKEEHVLKAGSLEGALVIGFSLQETYTVSDKRHKGHHYPNDTRQELNPGCKIGVITGRGSIQTINYKGVVAAGDDVYYDPADGKLVASGGAAVSGNKLPAKFRTSGNGSDSKPAYVRVEFNFPVL